MKSVLYSFLFLPFVLAGKNQTLAPTPDILRPTSIPGTYAPTYEREIHPTPMPTIDRVGLVPEPTPRPTRRPVAMSYEYVMDGFNDGDNCEIFYLCCSVPQITSLISQVRSFSCHHYISLI